MILNINQIIAGFPIYHRTRALCGSLAFSNPLFDTISTWIRTRTPHWPRGPSAFYIQTRWQIITHLVLIEVSMAILFLSFIAQTVSTLTSYSTTGWTWTPNWPILPCTWKLKLNSNHLKWSQRYFTLWQIRARLSFSVFPLTIISNAVASPLSLGQSTWCRARSPIRPYIP